MMRFVYTSLALLIVLSVLYGCKPKIPHELSPSFLDLQPSTIAIIPANHISDESNSVFTKLVYEKLKEKGYKPIIPDKNLKLYLDPDKGIDGVKDLSKRLKADGILLITTEDWEKKNLKFYMAIKVGARFELYNGRSGKRIWESHNDIKDSVTGIKGVDLASFRSLEPYAVRVVDISFATLPYVSNKLPTLEENEGKHYYKWLKDRR